MGGPSSSTSPTTKNTTATKRNEADEAVALQMFPFSDIPLPSDFVPTKEEQSLLDIYASVRVFEKEAAKFREAQAKAKLTAADERYKKQTGKERKENQPVVEEEDEVEGKSSLTKKKGTRAESKTRKRKERSSTRPNEGEEEHEDICNEQEEDSDKEEPFVSIPEHKSQSTPNISAEEKAAMEEEAMREEHLGETSMMPSVNMGPSLKKKKKKKKGPDMAALLSSVEPLSTPPHDFSKSLGMGKDGTDGEYFVGSFSCYRLLAARKNYHSAGLFVGFLFFAPNELQAAFYSLHLLQALPIHSPSLQVGRHQLMQPTQLIDVSKFLSLILVVNL